MGTYCYVVVCTLQLGSTRRFGAYRGRRGAGHIVAAARLQLEFKRQHNFAHFVDSVFMGLETATEQAVREATTICPLQVDL